jgi:septum site-determining protein MinC
VENLITLKGMFDSMLRCIIPEDIRVSDFPAEFEAVKAKGEAILHGARVVLDFGGRALSEKVIGLILSDFVWPSGMTVEAWITYDASSQEILKRAGFRADEPTQDSAGRVASGALVLHRSLRSGQRVEYRGDVIISGHVNDGADVIASGSVTVLGRLSGVVHSGYEGDESAVVAARSMEAPQVRIGGKIGSLDRGAAWWGKSVIASVKDGAVLIEYWPAVKNDTIKNETKEEPA